MAAERRMMDSILGPVKVVKNKTIPSNGQPPRQDESPSAPAAGSGAQLVSTMAQRLQQLETAQASLRTEMVARDRELLAARRQIEVAMADAHSSREALAVANGEPGAHERSARRENELAIERTALETAVHRLREENGRLRSRVGAMEAFLSDYGLVWVGEEGEEVDEDEERALRLLDGSSASESGPAAHRVDFERLKHRLAQLNSLAGEGRTVVVERNGAHILEKPKGMPLVLHADGIMLGRGPFRPFGVPLTDVFIADLLDGYFPFEFKDSHPNGLIFEVTDKSGRKFGDASAAGSESVGHPPSTQGSAGASTTGGGPSFVPFSGEARSTGAPSTTSLGMQPTGRGQGQVHVPVPASVPVPVRPGSRADSRVATLALAHVGGSTFHMPGYGQGQDPAVPMPAQALLAALPQTTIVGGNVVDVRGAVVAALGQQPAQAQAPVSLSGSGAGLGGLATGPGIILADTPVIRALRARAAQAALAGDSGGYVEPPFDLTNVTTLQVRLDAEGGRGVVRVLLVKLLAEDSVGDVRTYVDAARRAGSGPYELRTAVPVRAYEDAGQTLRQAGLVPNATLIVRAKA